MKKLIALLALVLCSFLPSYAAKDAILAESGLKFKYDLITKEEHPMIILGGYNPNIGTITSISTAGSNALFTTAIGGTASVPSVNFALAQATAYKYWGNNTGTTATPSFVGPIAMQGGGTGASLTPSAGAIPVSGASQMALLPAGGLYTQLAINAAGSPAYAFGLMGFQGISSATTLGIFNPSYNAISASSNFTVTLPPAINCPGKLFILEQVSGSGTVTLAGNGSDTIEGSSSITLLNKVSVVFISDGVSTWRSAGGGTTFNSLAPSTALGGILYGNGVNTYGNLPLGLPYQVIGNSGSGIGYLNGLFGITAQTTSVTLTTSSPSYNTIAPGSSPATVTLPVANTCGGKVFIIEQISGTGSVTISRSSSDTIEGNTSIAGINANTPYGYISDGSSTWRAISSAGLSFNQLAPTAATGAILATSAANTYSSVAGNTTTTRQFWTSLGTGSASTLPFPSALTLADMPVGAGSVANGGVQSASFTAAISQNYSVSLASANVTCTLPDATLYAGQNIELGISAVATGNSFGLGFATTSSQTIDGLTAANFPGMNDLYGKIVFRSEGGNWRVVSRS